MMSLAAAVMEDIVVSLRGCGALEQVLLGEHAQVTAVPRAQVVFEGQEVFAADDEAGGKWIRVRARVSLHIRSEDAAGAARRLAELYEAAEAALGADRFRGGLCCDLPIGRASEIGRGEVSAAVKRPEAQMTFSVRCHLQGQVEA